MPRSWLLLASAQSPSSRGYFNLSPQHTYLCDSSSYPWRGEVQVHTYGEPPSLPYALPSRQAPAQQRYISQGRCQISDVYASWLIWWMGDAIGLITLTPALYISVEYLRGNKSLNRLPPARTALTLSISSILAILTFIFFYNYDSVAIQEKVDKEVRIFSLKT